jgi:IS30 family transposase
MASLVRIAAVIQRQLDVGESQHEDKLNNRRRKTLGFKTPSEVFFASSN